MFVTFLTASMFFKPCFKHLIFSTKQTYCSLQITTHNFLKKPCKDLLPVKQAFFRYLLNLNWSIIRPTAVFQTRPMHMCKQSFSRITKFVNQESCELGGRTEYHYHLRANFSFNVLTILSKICAVLLTVTPSILSENLSSMNNI